jgi:hypothetical protein
MITSFFGSDELLKEFLASHIASPIAVPLVIAKSMESMELFV